MPVLVAEPAELHNTHAERQACVRSRLERCTRHTYLVLAVLAGHVFAALILLNQLVALGALLDQTRRQVLQQERWQAGSDGRTHKRQRPPSRTHILVVLLALEPRDERVVALEPVRHRLKGSAGEQLAWTSGSTHRAGCRVVGLETAAEAEHLPALALHGLHAQLVVLHGLVAAGPRAPLHVRVRVHERLVDPLLVLRTRSTNTARNQAMKQRSSEESTFSRSFFSMVLTTTSLGTISGQVFSCNGDRWMEV